MTINITLAIAAIISAIAAVISAAAAVFGKDVARRLVRPRLLIELDNPRGNQTFLSTPDGRRVAGSRWFHVNVQASDRNFAFSNAIVHLRELKTEGLSGELETEWSGRYPLTWRHEPPSIDPTTGEQLFRTKTIGPLAQADVFWIHEQMGLLIGSRMPNDLKLIVERVGKPGSRVRVAAVVKAVSDEGDSHALQVEITWSGVWAEADSDFRIEVKQAVVSIPN